MKNFWLFIKGFFPIWIILIAILTASSMAWLGHWQEAKIVGICSFVAFMFLLIVKPMNVVYGLMGTKGKIRQFFIHFIIISVVFASIYYWGFLKDSAISYDVNQPHIEFNSCNLLIGNTFNIESKKRIPIYIEGCEIPSSYIEKTEIICYQKIDPLSVLSNTVMTSLMQEPTDLFASAATYNSNQDISNRSSESIVSLGVVLTDNNMEKAQAFHLVLIFQILISWIFFGVFISLLYSKFRYES